MITNVLRSTAGAFLLAASGWACASQPVELTEAQLDTVSAGSVAIPQASQFASIGALSYALSTMTVTPGVVAYIDAGFNVHVGTAGNGAVLIYDLRVVQ